MQVLLTVLLLFFVGCGLDVGPAMRRIVPDDKKDEYINRMNGCIDTLIGKGYKADKASSRCKQMAMDIYAVEVMGFRYTKDGIDATHFIPCDSAETLLEKKICGCKVKAELDQQIEAEIFSE